MHFVGLGWASSRLKHVTVWKLAKGMAMYKLLLSWRYLRTRYIALASIISVTLGVATLIIVNAVMAGFTVEANKRLNGILSDIVFESHSLGGFPDADWHKEQIREVVGDDLVGMTATVHVPAMLSIHVGEQYLTRPVTLIGVDEATYAEVGDFAQYLLHPENRKQLSFRLHENGYAPGRDSFPESGWEHRRARVLYQRAYEEQLEIERSKLARETRSPESSLDPTAGAVPADPNQMLPPADIYGGQVVDSQVFDEMTQQHTGIILGIALCSQRVKGEDGEVGDHFFCRPGDDVALTFPTAAVPPQFKNTKLTVVDLYESKMSEYDSTLAFMPLKELQDLRGMIFPESGTRSVTSIQIKLKPGTDLNLVRDRLQAHFPITQFPYRIQTWRDMQGPLLAAVQLETTILNILLFLIIAVAGFGILATFYMIVVEKTRDVGILKALGAPSRGVMSIFLGYGFSLGLVGSGVGIVLGLLFVRYINQVAVALERLTGRPIFDPTVYYFREIPTIVEPITVIGVMVGAIAIAVLASVLPARRAARLHPVEALRYE
jgi:lipoprotein-releasing system permease protein